MAAPPHHGASSGCGRVVLSQSTVSPIQAPKCKQCWPRTRSHRFAGILKASDGHNFVRGLRTGRSLGTPAANAAPRALHAPHYTSVVPALLIVTPSPHTSCEMASFGDLKTDAGIKELNEHLSTRSYISQ